MQVLKDSGSWGAPTVMTVDKMALALADEGTDEVRVFKNTPGMLAEAKVRHISTNSRRKKYGVKKRYQKAPTRAKLVDLGPARLKYRFEGVPFTELPDDIDWPSITSDKAEARRAIELHPYWFERGTRAMLHKTRK